MIQTDCINSHNTVYIHNLEHRVATKKKKKKKNPSRGIISFTEVTVFILDTYQNILFIYSD